MTLAMTPIVRVLVVPEKVNGVYRRRYIVEHSSMLSARRQYIVQYGHLPALGLCAKLYIQRGFLDSYSVPTQICVRDGVEVLSFFR